MNSENIIKYYKVDNNKLKIGLTNDFHEQNANGYLFAASNVFINFYIKTYDLKKIQGVDENKILNNHILSLKKDRNLNIYEEKNTIEYKDKYVTSIVYEGEKNSTNKKNVYCLSTIKFKNNGSYILYVIQLCVFKKYDEFKVIFENNLKNIQLNITDIYSIKSDNSEAKEYSRKKLITNITSNIKDGDKILLYCIVDYFINNMEINSKENLINEIKNIDNNKLNIIANSSNYGLYKLINNKKFDNLDINSTIKPLLDTLKDLDIKFENILNEPYTEITSNEKKYTNDEFYSINDSELGKIKIYKDGNIVGKNLFIDKCDFKYKIPVEFSGIRKIEIYDDELVEGKFNKDDFLESLKIVFNSKEELKNKIINSVIDIFEEDPSEEFIKIHISAFIKLGSKNSINVNVSFSFEEEDNELSGYIDLYWNNEKQSFYKNESGFY